MRKEDPSRPAVGASPAIRHPAIVSSIPGRMRLRFPLLRQGGPREDLVARLQAIDGMTSVEANAVTGSLLLRYEIGRGGQSAMEACVGDALAAALGREPGVPRATPPARKKAAREWNRVAKLGMLASLPVSLALAAAGSKRLHAVSGGVFTLLLLVHMAVHRRHLVK